MNTDMRSVRIQHPQGADNEEVLTMNTSHNYPSLRDGMAEESSCDLRPKVAKPYDNVHDNPSPDNIAVGEMQNVNSMDDNGVKLSSIAKAASDTTLVDEDIHDAMGRMVAVENETYADQPSNTVKAAERIVLMDNDIYESGGGIRAIENEAHEDKPVSIVQAADETDLLDNDIYESNGCMVGIENEAHTDRHFSVVKSADETDLMDNEMYESGGVVVIQNEDEPISMVKSLDEIDLMDSEIWESDGAGWL